MIMKHINFRKIIKNRIFKIFKRNLSKNEKLIKNLEAYAKKEKTKQ